MFKYISQDIQASFKYLPYSCIVGAIIFVTLLLVNRSRRLRGKESIAVVRCTIYYVYVVIMLYITYFSREVGSRESIDLVIFSTWGNNARNHAFVIENILLFIPFGFLAALAFKMARFFVPITMFGMITSFEIELMQLISKRGYFQIDDILTNTLGTMIGFVIFMFICGRTKEKLSKKVIFLQLPTQLLIVAGFLLLMQNF